MCMLGDVFYLAALYGRQNWRRLLTEERWNGWLGQAWNNGCW